MCISILLDQVPDLILVLGSISGFYLPGGQQIFLKLFLKNTPPPSYTSNRYKPFLIIYELKRMISEKLKKGFSPPYFITFIIMAASLNGIVKINEKNGSINARIPHQRT